MSRRTWRKARRRDRASRADGHLTDVEHVLRVAWVAEVFRGAQRTPRCLAAGRRGHAEVICSR